MKIFLEIHMYEIVIQLFMDVGLEHQICCPSYVEVLDSDCKNAGIYIMVKNTLMLSVTFIQPLLRTKNNISYGIQK
jgi:hypothetical protein